MGTITQDAPSPAPGTRTIDGTISRERVGEREMDKAKLRQYARDLRKNSTDAEKHLWYINSCLHMDSVSQDVHEIYCLIQGLI